MRWGKGVVGSVVVHAALLGVVWTWTVSRSTAGHGGGSVSLCMHDAPPSPEDPPPEDTPEIDPADIVFEELEVEPEAEPVEYDEEETDPSVAGTDFAIEQARAPRPMRLRRPLPHRRGDPAPASPPAAAARRPAAPQGRAAPVGPTSDPVLLNLRAAQPRYPDEALRRGLEGSVTVCVEVDANGDVVRTTIDESSGHALLDAAVVEAARRWRFKPALRRGEPVAARYTRTVRFRLVS